MIRYSRSTLGGKRQLACTILLALCFVLVFFFSPLSTVIYLLVEERARLCAFRAFVCFARVGLCLVFLPFGVWDWL